MAEADAKEEKCKRPKCDALDIAFGLIAANSDGCHEADEERRDRHEKTVPMVGNRESDRQDPQDDQGADGWLSEHPGSTGEFPVTKHAHEGDARDRPGCTEENWTDHQRTENQ